MVQQLTKTSEKEPILEPDMTNLITEDDTPVDNFGSEKQQRFLTSVLYTARPNQRFLVCANVGIYHTYGEPPIVPDVFLSLDVETPENWWEKSHRCYVIWEFGKIPEVAIEIVSNQVGEELGKKFKIYQRMRVSYYVVYDPSQQLSTEILRIFKLNGSKYVEQKDHYLEEVELGLTLWEGEFEGRNDRWLRWFDLQNITPDSEIQQNILLTGDELAKQAKIEAKQAKTEAQQAQIKAQKLIEQLRALGIEPNL